jgi:hypothetical protein
LPELFIVADPVGKFAKGAGDEGVDAEAALPSFLHEAGFAEDFEMLRDGGKRHLEGLGKLHHAFTAGGEAVEELAPRGVGDCTDDVGVCAGAGHEWNDN